MRYSVPVSRSSAQKAYLTPATPLAQSGDPPEYASERQFNSNFIVIFCLQFWFDLGFYVHQNFYLHRSDGDGPALYTFVVVL